MNFRNWAPAISLWLALGGAHLAFAQASPPQKVFRYAYQIAETGFDPAQISDLYSAVACAHMFDAPYKYDYLARPAKVKPNLAEAMPVVSPDFRSYTFRLKKGIYFADDPAFGGKRRELVAADFVYTFKRFFDPANKSPNYSSLAEEGVLGLEALHKKAEAGDRFDYDSEVDGIKALDRYTVQIKLAESRPRFINNLADPSTLGIVAREVIEKYADRTMEHPVGTGPFMLKAWRRSSEMVFERNPGYREVYFDGEPTPGDKRAETIAAQMKGKRLPIVDKVIVSVIDEPQPRWLSFLNNEHDFMERLPQNFVTQAIPNNTLAPNLAKRGIQMAQVPLTDLTMFYFRMDDPVVGGYTPDKVALRRAVALALDNDEEVRLPRHGQAIVAQSFIMPNTSSYDPAFRTELGTFDRARAIALLDMFGYTDKNADGWRDMPDGSPLVLYLDTLGRADYRALDEVMKKNLDSVGVKLVLRIGQWPEQLKASRAGKLQMWGFGVSGSSPDSAGLLEYMSSKSIGQQNHSRFKNSQFDALYQRQRIMPDGAERDAVIKDANRVLAAYMPYKPRVHRIGTDLWQPWTSGYMRHPFAREFWQYIDIDPAKMPPK
ncbi:MAG: ABC transporter substrate-binding protein [Pseudomonadota bacterium]|nr:ABC transporter substrate-binding protein [Pseudomonadota bacterium]